MKKVLIIEGSPRVNGNSDVLAKAFAKGAEESGNKVETIAVRDLKLEPCIACYSCRKTGRCFRQDKMGEVLEKMVQADVIVMASPVYFYSITGQLKVFIDRVLPKYADIRNKEFYLIVTAADDNDLLEPAMLAMQGFVDCCADSEVKGKIYGGGFYEKGVIAGSAVETQAYEMGKKI